MTENRSFMRPGDVVDQRFVVEALAGSGGMGAVYRARDRSSDVPVAVKVLTEGGSDARFELEARLLAELDHPAIVGYRAHGRTADGQTYLAMEWLEGEDLQARLARQPPSVDEARAIARRAAEGLAFAHARAIVHRDIKPGNLFLVGGDPSRLKVVDFGIARSRTAGALDETAVPITRTGTVFGTVGYMAPEQARGASELDARADVFALGCVLFECVTGHPAFAGPNAIAVLAKVLLEEAPRARHFAPSIPVDLDDLIARMLSKDPELRPRDGAAVVRALDTTGIARRPSSSSGGVADREQRMVTIVLVRGVDPPPQAIVLAGGVHLLEFRGHDPVVQAAAAALQIARQHPLASVAIATGRVADTHASAYGPIIDRVATLPACDRGIPIDDLSATMLGDRFEVDGGVLLGPTRAEMAPRTLLGKSTPHVGRDKETALLTATFRECADEPVARCVLVTGVAGSGKSRLAHELVSVIKGDARILIARADPVGAGAALGVVRQLVRNAAGIHERDPIEAQHRVLEAHLEQLFAGDRLVRTSEMLGELVGAPAPSPSAQLRAARKDPRVLSTWVAQGFADWIAALADAGPTLCLIEDLHWGDAGSVAYFDEALRTNASRPLMTLALSRPEVHDLFPSLWARSGVQEIKLSSLTRRAGERLVASVLPELDVETTARIVERADGNAFRLEELIRHVSERGMDSLPESILALAEGRLARLDPEARRFLRVASVFGETFWEPGVAALLGPDAEIASVLPRLVASEVVVPGMAHRFHGEHHFRHGLLRDAAYEMLVAEDRRALHLRAGEWLEGAGEQEPLVLAEHFERAGERLRAAPCLYRAACDAASSGNVLATASLAERSVRSGAEGELLGKVRALESTAAVFRGDHLGATALAKEAYGLLPRLSPEWYVAAATALSSGAWVGDFELAPSILHELLTTTPEGVPTGPYGYALAFAVDILDALGQADASTQLIANADALVARYPEVGTSFRANLEYARIANLGKSDGDIGPLLVLGARGAELAASANDGVMQSRFDYGMGFLHVEVGDARVGRAFYEKARAGQKGATLFETWIELGVGWCDVLEGRWSDAVGRARKAFALDPHHAYALAAHAHVVRGQQSEAEQLSERSLRGIRDGLVTPFVIAMAETIAARVALEGGRADEADRLSASALAAGVGTPWIRSMIHRNRIEVLLARGDDASALVARAAERIQRQARSLGPAHRASYLERIPDNARIMELAQR